MLSHNLKILNHILQENVFIYYRVAYSYSIPPPQPHSVRDNKKIYLFISPLQLARFIAVKLLFDTDIYDM